MHDWSVGIVQVGQVVEGFRREAGLTQAELAARIGTTQAAISKIETGRTMPGLELLDRIARGVGRQMTFTLGEETRPIPTKERRRRARIVLGDFEFDPWDRNPSAAERDSLLADEGAHRRSSRSDGSG
jgi:transcriptional regulator with XRE-family HTH domain